METALVIGYNKDGEADLFVTIEGDEVTFSQVDSGVRLRISVEDGQRVVDFFQSVKGEDKDEDERV